MKVICIDENICTTDGKAPYFEYPKVGDIVTVEREVTIWGIKMYVLVEFPTLYEGKRISFDADCFAPLNGPDEKERLEAYQRERLTQEDKMLMALAENMPEEKLDPVANERIMNNLNQIFGW